MEIPPIKDKDLESHFLKSKIVIEQKLFYQILNKSL